MKKAAQQVGQASSLPFARASLPVVALNRQGPQNQLPNGWRWVKLDDVCEHRTGVRDPRREADKPFRYVDITSVDNKAKSIVEAKTVLGKDAPSRARQIIRSPDVVVSTTRPNLNAVALVPPELDGQICSTGFCVLRAKPDLDSDYLFASVQTSDFVERLSGLVKGALYPAVTDKQVREQVIPLPPLSEQKRIAGILKEQMSAAEAARRSAEAELQAAESLPAAYLGAVFKSPEAVRWSKQRLGEIGSDEGCFTDGPFGSNLKTEHYTTGGARVVRLQNIGRGEFLDSDKAYVSNEHFDSLQRHHVQPGDVVMAALGDGVRPAGRACKIPDGFGPGLVKADCFRIRLPKEKACPDYLVAVLNSLVSLASIAASLRGATRPRVTLKILREVEMPLPPLTDQRRIAAQLSSQMSSAERLRWALAEQLDAINKLPAALLRRGFSGEL